jgi:hypothetical protein
VAERVLVPKFHLLPVPKSEGCVSVELQSFFMTEATTHQTLRKPARRAACDGAQQNFILMPMHLTKASANVIQWSLEV